MKKLMLMLLFTIVILFAGNQTAKAIQLDNVPVNFQPFNHFADHNSMRTGIEALPYNPGLIYVTVPNSTYNRFEQGGVDSKIIIYDENETQIHSVNLNDLSQTVGGTYNINLDALGIDNAEYIRVQVMQTWASAPGGYTTWFNDNAKVEATFEIDQEVLQDIIYQPYNYFSDTWGMRTDRVSVPFGKDVFTFQIPNTNYNDFTQGGIDSQVTLYDTDSNVLLEIDLESISTNNSVGGVYTIFFDDYEVSNVASLRIEVMQTFASVPGGYYEYFNDNAFLMFDEPNVATFYVFGEVYERIYFVNTFNRISAPTLSEEDFPDGVTPGMFRVWVDSNGDSFNFNRSFDSDVDIFARYGPTRDDPFETYKEDRLDYIYMGDSDGNVTLFNIRLQKFWEIDVFDFQAVTIIEPTLNTRNMIVASEFNQIARINAAGDILWQDEIREFDKEGFLPTEYDVI